MRALELLWHLVNRARRALYRAGILRAKRLHRRKFRAAAVASGNAGP